MTAADEVESMMRDIDSILIPHFRCSLESHRCGTCDEMATRADTDPCDKCGGKECYWRERIEM